MRPVLRCLRLTAATLLALLMAACVAHQLVQLIAAALPSTPGLAIGEPEVWASVRFDAVHRRRINVPGLDLRLLAQRYRFELDGRSHEATRIRLERAWPGRADEVPERVDVHFLPTSPRLAIADPALSPLLWFFLLCAGIPVLVLLWRPRWMAAWMLRTVRALPARPLREDVANSVQGGPSARSAKPHPRRSGR